MLTEKEYLPKATEKATSATLSMIASVPQIWIIRVSTFSMMKRKRKRKERIRIPFSSSFFQENFLLFLFIYLFYLWYLSSIFINFITFFYFLKLFDGVRTMWCLILWRVQKFLGPSAANASTWQLHQKLIRWRGNPSGWAQCLSMCSCHFQGNWIFHALGNSRCNQCFLL